MTLKNMWAKEARQKEYTLTDLFIYLVEMFCILTIVITHMHTLVKTIELYI